ncbi:MULTISPECIES: bZIP transcription factor [Methylobacillus]|uniref:Transmembrane protein n=1 Tax=Methylobacillus flagellatus (strain ATCC 51484 / DSM 6875 / VKM B-1610 / KT) TaxID=265072 RepID=Q1H2J1_METFK|nr:MULTISPECIES: bZIP transcription factor [Methylobacillus]ABE49152.1 conserved hypothetical protein [Methylobacillus flagellatus KT]ABE49296.1 conserved hypothetical protein [Methylobacillus flagellatus KT]MPS49797.1 hypothetical protein [Methylobacillus sp.]
MAAPWLTVLKVVPWVEVIRKAPEIAEGARKFWHAVSGKQNHHEPPVYDVPYSELPSDDDKEARIQSLEVRIAQLQTQMVESSKLLKTLADQNEQLVAKLEDGRRRVARLSRIVMVLVIAMLAVSAWIWHLPPMAA